MAEHILVVGASGELGSAIVRHLRADGRPVRALVRDRKHFANLEQLGAEPVQGDLLDRDSLERACNGITHVITTANAFMGRGGNGSRNVDLYGNLRLVDVARKHHVQRFIFMSGGATIGISDVDFFRYKARVEDYLQQSSMDWVIVRAGAFFEMWANIVAGTIATKGVATIFGTGDNPINFVSREDVARFIARLATDSSVSREIIELAGPENLTLLQVVEQFERHHGRIAKRKHVPVPLMRALGTVTRPFDAVLSRKMTAGLEMALKPQAMDARPVTTRFPHWRPQTLAEWLTGGPRT